MSDEKQEFETAGDILKKTEYAQALPEVRLLERKTKIDGFMLVEEALQQRWRIMTYDGKPPRHEWRDVPTVKEG